jgi:hypothetical protein
MTSHQDTELKEKQKPVSLTIISGEGTDLKTANTYVSSSINAHA